MDDAHSFRGEFDSRHVSEDGQSVAHFGANVLDGLVAGMAEYWTAKTTGYQT